MSLLITDYRAKILMISDFGSPIQTFKYGPQRH